MIDPGKALVTGGAGFIGSRLAQELLDRGWEVYALDDLSTGSVENVEHLRDRPDFHLVVESVLSQSVVSELVHKCDAVWHLAAAVGVRLIVEQPGRTLLTNVQGTETVLEYCARFEKPVLITSSSEVVGDHPAEQQPLREDTRRIYGPTTAKRWAYADSKALDEFLALALHEERGCVSSSRACSTRSARARVASTGWWSRALSAPPWRTSRSRCTVTATRLAASATSTTPLARCVELLGHGGLWGEIYNVGSTESLTINELAERILAATGSSSELTYIPYDEVYGHGIEEMFHRIPDLGKVRAAIGWEPTSASSEIIADVIAAQRSRHVTEPAT